MTLSDYPLVPDDLRQIADAIEEVEETTLAANSILGRIELFRPDGDDRIGWVTRFVENDPDMGWGVVFDEANE